MPHQTAQHKRSIIGRAARLALLCLTLLLLASCARSPGPTADPIPAATSPTPPPAAAVVEDPPLAQPSPTAALPTAAAPTPQEVEEVQGAYRLVVVTQLFADLLNQAALDAQSGAKDVLDTQASLVLAGVISTGISGARTDLSPPEPMASYADEAQEINLALNEIATSWKAKEQTPDQVIAAIEPLLADLTRVMDDAETAMAGQWQLTPAAIAQLRQDIIAEVTEILANLASPPTPDIRG